MKSFANHISSAAALVFLLPTFSIAAPLMATGAKPVSLSIEPKGNYTCDFIMTRVGASGAKRRELMAFGEVIVSTGNIRLLGDWLTEGKHQAKPFAGSELRIDDGGNVDRLSSVSRAE